MVYCVKCGHTVVDAYCQLCGAVQPASAVVGFLTSNVDTAAAADPDKRKIRFKMADGNMTEEVGWVKTVVAKGARTIVKSFPHYSPQAGIEYFAKDMPQGPAADSSFLPLTTVIPFFNEESHELRRTLLSLRDEGSDVVGFGFRMHVLVILDGWWKASASMKEYMKEMFPDSSEQPWFATIGPIVPGKEVECVETLAIQRIGERGDIRPVTVGTDPGTGRPLKMRVSLLVKRDNRRKHNSHEWFLQSFAPRYQSEFVFLTDCGTLFERGCLFALVRELWRDKSCSAVTGRQRVMTASMQGQVGESWKAWFYRMAQCYDYESSLASFTGAFSLLGMLPVVPGPCGLYRFKCIYDYKKVARQLAGASGGVDKLQVVLQSGNDSAEVKRPLLAPPPAAHGSEEDEDLAEELRMDCVDRCGRFWCGRIERQPAADAADFYFRTVNQNPDEAGMMMATLLLAEDRILSYAAVVKSLLPAHTSYVPHATFYFEAETVPEVLLQQRRRWINGTVAGYMWLFSNLRLVWFSTLSVWRIPLLTMLIFAQVMMYAVVCLSPSIFALGLHFCANATFPDQTGGQALFYCYLLLYFLFVFLHHRSGLPRLHRWLFDIVTLVNVALSLWLLAIVIYAVIYQRPITLLIWLVLGTMFAPFALALLHSPTSFLLMLKSWLPFYVFLPTMVGYFGAYSFARTWELTWGNRPSDNLPSVKKVKTKEQLDRVKADLQDDSSFICWMIVVLNVLNCLLVPLVESQQLSLLIIGCFVAGWAGVQMAVSVLFFLRYLILRFFDMLVLNCRCFFMGVWSRDAAFMAERGMNEDTVKAVRTMDFEWDDQHDFTFFLEGNEDGMKRNYYYSNRQVPSVSNYGMKSRQYGVSRRSAAPTASAVSVGSEAYVYDDVNDHWEAKTESKQSSIPVANAEAPLSSTVSSKPRKKKSTKKSRKQDDTVPSISHPAPQPVIPFAVPEATPIVESVIDVTPQQSEALEPPAPLPAPGVSESDRPVADLNTAGLDETPLPAQPNEADAAEEAPVCRVCQHLPADVLLLPCAHIAVCQSCQPQVNQCPECAQTFEEFHVVHR